MSEHLHEDILQWDPPHEPPARYDKAVVPSAEGDYSLGFPTAATPEAAKRSVNKLLELTKLLLVGE